MKHIRPDEYYNDGIFELARFGNLTSAVNHMSPNQHNHYLQSLAAKYDTCVSEIDTIVDKIRSLVKISDPENLLNFLVSMNILGSLNKESEVDYTAEMNFQLRSIEYVQSILVSSNNTYNQTEDLDDEKNYYEILDLTVKLYSKIHSFYSFWAAKIQLTNSLTEEELNYSMMAQMMSFVRGNQYQIFRLDVLRELIAPHNKELAEIYGMTVDDLMKGLQIMEHNLSSGRLDAINDLQRLMDEFQEPSDFITDEYRNRAGESINQFIGIDLYNVKKHTKWPDSLIEDLSLGIGSDNTFFMHDQCNGWPVWELPVQRKPFIKLNGQSYCFDYYNLFDNFYRSLQTAIFSHGEQYKETWRAAQTDASEEMVSKLFTKLLPGCSVHRSNHYPINGGNAENDIIITHKDVLIIIEVKAGSFTYTPALFDLKAHKESLKNLIQKGEKQCIRTKNYILSCAEADFYTDDKLKHYSFSLKEKDFSQIYMLDVTVDSINEIASAIEKVQIANAQEDIISLSIEDLWVYADYFNSPAQFVHFLKQRFLSTNTEEVYTLDELDHLGLYIHHSMYTLQAKELGRGNRVHFSGYREDLDRYYANLYRGNTIEKPGQKIPDQIIRIIDICHSRKDITSPFKISNFLLDLSTDSKQLFVDWIYKLSSREKEKGYTIPAMHFGDASYCMIVNTPFVKKTELNVSDYIYANLLKSGRDSCFLFEIELDHQDLINNTYAKEYKNSDIPIDRLDELKAWGDEIVTERIKRYGIQDTRVKIGRNEQCPCGSGKKFKKCCGRKAVDP